MHDEILDFMVKNTNAYAAEKRRNLQTLRKSRKNVDTLGSL
jgi:hypothetical protein